MCMKNKKGSLIPKDLKVENINFVHHNQRVITKLRINFTAIYLFTQALLIVVNLLLKRDTKLGFLGVICVVVSLYIPFTCSG